MNTFYDNNDYRAYLAHYAKGKRAKKHKYLYIDEKGRYVYPSDKKNTNTKSISDHITSLVDTLSGNKKDPNFEPYNQPINGKQSAYNANEGSKKAKKGKPIVGSSRKKQRVKNKVTSYLNSWKGDYPGVYDSRIKVAVKNGRRKAKALFARAKSSKAATAIRRYASKGQSALSKLYSRITGRHKATTTNGVYSHARKVSRNGKGVRRRSPAGVYNT